MLGNFRAGLAADVFDLDQTGGTSDSSAVELAPSVALGLRWPLQKISARGVSHVIEPMVQLAWTGGTTPDIPNEQSTRIEFDEGNLFSVSRFNAADRRERGLSAAYGVSWTRHAPQGWQSSLAVGQVIRDETLRDPDDSPAFTRSSGLRGRFSDLLVAARIRTDDGRTLTARSLLDDEYSTTKTEARISWQNDLADIGASYIWLREDPAEDRSETVSEWLIDGSYRLSRHWTGSANWRYDIADDRNVTAGIGLTYTNECVEATLSASRRFTSSTTLDPSTDISLTVALRGFTTKSQDRSYVRTCRN